MRKNRNSEIERDPDMGFDYKAFDDEQKGIPVEEHEEYEEYELFDVQITETVSKTITVLADSARSAKQEVEDRFDEIDMQNDIDEYKKVVTVTESGGSYPDMIAR